MSKDEEIEFQLRHSTQCQGPAFQRYPSRPKWAPDWRSSTVSLSRVLRTAPAALIHKNQGNTLGVNQTFEVFRNKASTLLVTCTLFDVSATQSGTDVSEVFTLHPITAEAISLPWPFVHLESFPSSAPPIARLLS
jgi:hypothetical protein